MVKPPTELATFRMSDIPLPSSIPAVPAPSTMRLRTLLIVPFVLLVVVPAVIIAALSLYTGLHAVDVLSRQLIGDISARVEQAVVHQLEEAAVTLVVTFPNVDDNHNASNELFGSTERLERKLFELTAAARTTTYLCFGREDGAYVGVHRAGLAANSAATVRLQQVGGDALKSYLARTPGDRSQPLETNNKIFDVRNRPWYQIAKTARHLTWTPVYWSIASSALVTTAAQPVMTASGTLLGVFSANVELSELSAFMRTVAVSANSVVFILDRDGLLVASSTAESPFRTEGGVQKRVAARDSESALVRAGAQWWRAAGRSADRADKGAPSIAVINTTGEQVDVASRRVTGVDGIDWDIVVAVPRSDFTASIMKSATSVLFVILAALAAALALGLYVLRRVTRDVDQVVVATKQISADGLPLLMPVTSLAETAVLSNAFGEMVARYTQSLETIRAKNDQVALLNVTLEERVERRTTQLGAQNHTLTEEILRRKRLERELRQTSQAAQKAAQDKARFLAILSHELRTPLQAVIGASHLLSARRCPGEPAYEIETMDAASKSLLTLIDGVLSYSRLESGMVTPTLHSFVLAECIEEAIQVARAALPRAEVALVVDVDSSVPRVIHTDQGMLRQVVINLLGNALKFTTSGEVRITVSADPVGRADDPLRLRFAVVDTGSGIDLDTQQRLFQPFQQGDAEDGKPQVGSGLGLAICAMLVRALDGEIDMASELGKGTRMSFSILAQVPPTAAAAQLSTPIDAATRLRSLRVLVVEDNDVNRELLSIMLEQFGHRVDAVADGETAISRCAEQPFDAVLMDLNLPRIGGIEATRRILLDHAERGHPPAIIALTASVSDADRELCAAAGMREFLTKPATVFSLDLALRGAVGDAPLPEPAAVVTGEVLDEVTLKSLADLDQRAAAPFLRKLMERFIEGLPTQVAHIKIQWDAGQTKAALYSAHSLAGAASTVGASALARATRRVSESPSSEAVDAVEAVSQATVVALTSWMSGNLPVEAGKST